MQLLREKNRNVYNGEFKPAFYTSGQFGDLWNGDQSVLERLRLLEGVSGWVLLAKVSFSPPEKTDIEGLVSVPGTLSMMLVNREGRNGPWDFRAAGAGVSRQKQGRTPSSGLWSRSTLTRFSND